MRKDIFRDCHWEKHGEYWILHDEVGRAVGMLVTVEQILGLNQNEREMGEHERGVTVQARRIGI